MKIEGWSFLEKSLGLIQGSGEAIYIKAFLSPMIR